VDGIVTTLGPIQARDVVQPALGWGIAAAQTYDVLSARLGLPRREIEAAVEEMRRAGVPVCTGPAGAWLTQDPGEVREQYRRLRRRALHQLANLRRMLRTAEVMERPLVLPWAKDDAA
jgi:biotin operon repressor